MLPAWLGSDEALSDALRHGSGDLLRTMYSEWTFFQVYIDMLEMVLAKSDPDIAAHYEGVLLGEDRALGQLTRVRLQSAIENISEIKQVTELLEREPAIAALSLSAIHIWSRCIFYRQSCCVAIAKVHSSRWLSAL